MDAHTRIARRLTVRTFVVALAAVVVGACGGGGGSHPGATGSPVPSAPDASVARSGSSSTAAASGEATDPCQALTKADVQPFFTVPIATELPGPALGSASKSCEWAAADGSAQTSLQIIVRAGDDAQTFWQLSATDKNRVSVPGVGDQASRLPGDTALIAMKGGVVCGITTFGKIHLAGLQQYATATQIPEDAATAIAENFGTLCNKLFGAGSTTPSITAAATGPESTTTTTTPAKVVAVGGMLGTTGFPLPVGIDCSGRITTDPGGAIECAATAADPTSIYPFYLRVLPQRGYTITHEQEAMSNGRETASILFYGNGFAGYSSIGVVGNSVTIDLRKE